VAEVDVNIDINVENNSSYEINEITNNVIHLHQAVQRQEEQNSRWSKALDKVSKSARSAIKAVAKVAATVAGIGAAAGPAVSGLLAAGKAVAILGKASARLLPLAAFLPSLLGSFVLIKKTATLMGPAFVKAFEPLKSYFVNAKGEASAFTKRLQSIAVIGLKPLVAEFGRLNMPAIGLGMERIAYQINGVVNNTLRLLNTTKGQQAIKTITEGTTKAVEQLGVKFIGLADAIIGLTARAGDRGIKAIGDAIGKVLDKLTQWANNTTVEDINNALSDLSGYGVKLRSTFTAVRDIGHWLAENEGAIKHFSDVASAAAITLGIATGNVPAIVLGAVSLIINHWNQLKGPFTDAIGWVKNIATAWQRDAGRIAIAESMSKAFAGFRAAFNSATKDVGPKWKEFVSQLKQAWEEWAPLIKIWWDNGGRQAFKAAGAALGIFVTNLVAAATAGAAFADIVAAAFKWLVMIVLDTLGGIVNGAAKAFGWIPGIGPKLNAAAAAFNDFRDRVNSALNGIQAVKTVRINASVYVTGGGNVAGGVDQRTGNSRNAGLSGLTSWQAAAAAFAGDRGGSRTGGPAPVTAEVSNTILLDGRPFRAYTVRAVAASESRSAWRTKTGRR
jgi:hypothetical protein